MNTKPPSLHEALSAEELELARVVRALPGGGPPAALDALILKAASDAVASHPEKKSHWAKGLLGTSALWIGTAAASVLTVGIGWQVFQSMRAPIYELPDDQNISSAQEVDRSQKDEPLLVEMSPAREPAPTSPPPEPFAESGQTADAAASMASNEKPKAIASEKREREEQARQNIAAQAAKKSDDNKTGMLRNQAAEMVAAPQAATAMAPPPAPPVLAGAAADARESKELDSVIVSGSRLGRADQISNGKITPRDAVMESSIDEDAKLPPAQWLDAIKVRMERNDIEGAKASLQRYKETHPKLRIPEELLPLLK